MDNERVEYSFTGDVTSLKKATKEAISLLDQYEGTVKDLAKNDNLNVGKTAFNGFQKTINGVIKQVNTLSGYMAKATQESQNALVPNTPAVISAYDSIAQALQFLRSSSKITTDDMKLVTMVLQDAKTSLEPLNLKIQAMGATFEKVAQTSEQSMQQVNSSVENTTQQTSSRVGTLGDKWDNYAKRMSKSAELSAAVFAEAGKFTGFATGVDTVVSKVVPKMVSMRDSINNTVNQITARFRSMTSVFDPIVAKIQSFKDKAVSAGRIVSMEFSTVAAAFRRTSDGTEGASRSQSKFGKILDNLKEKLGKHRTQLKEVSEGYSDMKNASEKAYSSMKSGADALKGTLSVVKNGVGGIVDSFFALAGVKVGDTLSESAKSAIDYVENLNLFQVAMGSSIDKGKAFVEQMQEVYGMDPSNVYRYAGYFYQLTDAIGMSEDASATMSLSMTKAANDLASLFNTDIQTVVNDLASGMQGMTKAVRKYGMDIRATTLEQTAMKYGLEGNVETMSEANRQALRYITMLEQAQNALHQTTDAVDGTSSELGDFARNIETPANQLRIFKEQMAQLGRAIGNFIVAPLSKALPYINGFVMALRTLVNFLATIAGVSVKAGSSLSSAGESAEDAASGVDSISGAADKASKKLKQLIAPFDELNVLQESSDSGDTLISDDALDPTLAKALAEMELNLENISMKANQVRDNILAFLGLKVTTDPITGEQIIQWDKEAFQTNVLDSLGGFRDKLSEISPLLATIAGSIGVITLLSLLGGLASKLGILLEGLSGALGFVKTALTLLTNPVFLVMAALTLLLTFSEGFRDAFVNLFTSVGASFIEWGGILAGVFATVGQDVVEMWSTHIQPTIEAIGNMLAPALGTLASLWENVSVIISDCFSLIGNIWTKVVKPALKGAMDLIQDLCAIIQEWWEKYFGPVFEYIGDGIQWLWTEKIKPVIDKIISIIGKLVELIMALWNNPLKPIVEWAGKVLGPVFVGVFEAIWDGVSWAIGLVMDIIKSLLGILEGLIDFLIGVFTGDWERAWKGIVNILVGVGNLIIDIFEGVVNGVIWLINSLIEAIWQAIQGLINIVLGAVEDIAGFLGWDLNLRLNAQVPNIPNLNIPRIPEVAMARGGVVTGPTRALIGEGVYDEAVIPLGDSPQMQDLVKQIADAVNKDDPTPQPVAVKVYIGDKEYDAYTYKASERGKKIVGKQPIKMGG